MRLSDTVYKALLTLIGSKQDTYGSQAHADSLAEQAALADLDFDLNQFATENDANLDQVKANQATALTEAQTFRAANTAENSAALTEAQSLRTTNTSQNAAALTEAQGFRSDLNTRVGATNETAPANDTAASGLNGRTQRIAQNVSTTNTNLGAQADAAAASDAATASLIALTKRGNQLGTTQITNLGAQADAVASSDTGTFSLIALFKRLLQGTTTANTNIGATNEAAAASDSATSGLNGLFKRLLARVTTLITTLTDGTQKSQLVNGAGNVAKLDATGNQYVVISNPSGNKRADITGNNHLRVTIEPTDLLYDKFDSTIDANIWAQAISGGGGISAASGLLSMTAPGANASAILTSVFNVEQRGNTYLEFGCNWIFEANANLNPNVYRFWGLANVVAPTYTVPQNDAVGFELSNGVLAAVVYAAGVKIFSATLSTTPLVDGLLHRYSFLFNTQFIYWYIDTNEVEVASANGFTPGRQIMPVKLLMLTNTSAPSVAPVFKNSAIAIADRGRNGVHIKDSKYPHRVATVDGSGAILVSSKAPLTASAPVAVTVGLTSALGIAANANRKGLTLTNTSVGKVSLGLGATAVLNSGITLYPGDSWQMDETTFTTAAINFIAQVAASNVGGQEFTA